MRPAITPHPLTGGPGARWPLLLLAGVLAGYALATVMAMRHTSTTFDEILLPSAGARGYATGDFDLVLDYHPRILPYLYGLPVLLSKPSLPDESQMEGRVSFVYSRALFFRSDADPERLAFRVRLVAVGLALSLIVLLWAFVRRQWGDGPALIAASTTAFLPDLVAHGGISYNDVPAALAFFGAVWASDRAAREASLRATVVAALLLSVALNVKYSAVALLPIVLILLVLEWGRRSGDERKRYRERMTRMLFVAFAVTYVASVVLNLGDFTLSSFRTGLTANLIYARAGDGLPTWLLGENHPEGTPLFFPVALFLKTPAALHGLVLLSLAAALTQRARWRELAHSPLRAPLAAVFVLGGMLLTAKLQIGVRHAFPVVPFLVVLTTAGLAHLWHTRGRAVRAVIVMLLALQAASTLSWYPHFIPYTTDYFRDRDRGHMLFTDSNHDWGQGLLLLREFMAEEGVDVVELSYFGSAVPEAYGIRYVPLRSFFTLGESVEPAEEPRFVAISATNLIGNYVEGAVSQYRGREPYRVLGHSVFVFERATEE